MCVINKNCTSYLQRISTNNYTTYLSLTTNKWQVQGKNKIKSL